MSHGQREPQAPSFELAAPTGAAKVSHGLHEPQAPSCPARSPHAQSRVVIAVQAAPPYFNRKCYYLVSGPHVMIKVRDPNLRSTG